MTMVQPLTEVLETLRAHGVRRGVAPEPNGPAAPHDALSTGHAPLDAALQTGGWPRGALALLDAPYGGGATTLALTSLAAAQASGGVVAYLDPSGSLDPAVAARLGIGLEWLLVVRPADAVEAVELAGWLSRERRIDAFVLDLADVPAFLSPRDLDRLAGLLVRSGTCALLLAGPRGRETAGRVAGVRVALRRRAWLAAGRDLVGQRVEAVVERHRWALAGGRAELDLFFSEGRRIDALLRPQARPTVPLEQRQALRVVSA